MRLIGLDAARASAIILLLVAHIGQTINSPLGGYFGIPNLYYVSLGGIAVTIFLILSGVVLELRYGRKDIQYFQFIAKRLLRIFPVYYLCLLFGIIVYITRRYHESGSFSAAHADLGIGDIFLSLTGGYAFVGKWGGPFVETSWFIALIITMYLLFPILSRVIERRPFLSIVLLFLISFVTRLVSGQFDILPMRPLDWFPPGRMFEFSLGIFLVVVLAGRRLFSWDGVSSRLSGRLRSSIVFISEISFPLFLVHYPLLFIISDLTAQGLNQLLAICVFIFVSLIVSWTILIIDKKLPRAFVIEKINDFNARKNIDSR